MTIKASWRHCVGWQCRPDLLLALAAEAVQSCMDREHFMWSVKNAFLQRTNMRARNSQRKHGIAGRRGN
nr:MAG TPA: hypothetical protein [Caudoviricetes sp.]